MQLFRPKCSLLIVCMNRCFIVLWQNLSLHQQNTLLQAHCNVLPDAVRLSHMYQQLEFLELLTQWWFGWRPTQEGQERVKERWAQRGQRGGQRGLQGWARRAPRWQRAAQAKRPPASQENGLWGLLSRVSAHPSTEETSLIAIVINQTISYTPSPFLLLSRK